MEVKLDTVRTTAGVKNTLSNFQKEVSAVTEDIDLEEKVQKNNKTKKNLDKNG